jgi:5-methylcytosine-specific restriction endonuclease McrA
VKRCPRCLSFKLSDEFYRNKSQKDGLQIYCKPCWNEYMKPRNSEYLRRVKPWLSEQNYMRQAEWRDRNRDAYNAGKRAWYYDNIDKARQLSADSRRRRRAKLRESATTPYLRGDIFERDGWKCGICGGPINRRLPSSHSRGPSIDHIIPISLGGPDTPDNVQAAHLSCNKARQAKPLAA